MKRLASFSSEILSESGGKLALNLKILSLWNSIVGKDLEGIAMFESASYFGKNKIKVCIKILNSAAMLISSRKQMISDQIKENLQMDEVNLIVKHSSFISEDKAHAA